LNLSFELYPKTLKSTKPPAHAQAALLRLIHVKCHRRYSRAAIGSSSAMTDCVAANELRDELGGLVGLIGGSAWPRY
jgi:hypothetical protein